MERARLIDYQGKQIFFQDFSNVTDQEELLRILAAASAFAAALTTASTGKTLRILTDVSESSFSPPIIDALREMAKYNKPYVLASAIIGVNAIKRVVFRVLILVTGRDISVFQSREQALDWLVRQ